MFAHLHLIKVVRNKKLSFFKYFLKFWTKKYYHLMCFLMCFTAWLLASVNVGEVQPKGEVTHLSDSDREPFFQSKSGAESFTSQDTMYSSTSSPVQTLGAQANYGATEQWAHCTILGHKTKFQYNVYTYIVHVVINYPVLNIKVVWIRYMYVYLCMCWPKAWFA